MGSSDDPALELAAEKIRKMTYLLLVGKICEEEGLSSIINWTHFRAIENQLFQDTSEILLKK